MNRVKPHRQSDITIASFLIEADPFTRWRLTHDRSRSWCRRRGHRNGLVSQEGRARCHVVERQSAAGMETSWGNGGVIHASEVEPWSQPGMPRKIIGWLGKENAPLLLRYSAIPHMWRWGIFASNCTPTRFRANAKRISTLRFFRCVRCKRSVPKPE